MIDFKTRSGGWKKGNLYFRNNLRLMSIKSVELIRKKLDFGRFLTDDVFGDRVPDLSGVDFDESPRRLGESCDAPSFPRLLLLTSPHLPPRLRCAPRMGSAPRPRETRSRTPARRVAGR